MRHYCDVRLVIDSLVLPIMYRPYIYAPLFSNILRGKKRNITKKKVNQKSGLAHRPHVIHNRLYAYRSIRFALVVIQHYIKCRFWITNCLAQTVHHNVWLSWSDKTPTHPQRDWGWGHVLPCPLATLMVIYSIIRRVRRRCWISSRKSYAQETSSVLYAVLLLLLL